MSIDTYSSSGAAVCFSRIFFSDVLKFLRIVFLFSCASWAILNKQNSLKNYNKNEKKQTKKKIRPKFSHANVNKTNKNS